MKPLKSSLLGSAAAFAAVGAANAADLPVKKAVPIEYVRVCNAYGAGFFYIPGTDTCIRLGGRVRGEYGFQSNENRSVGTQAGDASNNRGLARINIDTRTQTGYGTLRAFLRIDVATASGAFLTSGTRQRIGEAFPALGIDQFSRTQGFVNADKAFIQFAGFTAGRAASFFDFYAHDFEIVSGTAGSDVFSTNLMAYTATLGNGFTASLSMEDPNYRHQNVFNASNAATAAAVGSTSATVFFNSSAPTPLILTQDAAGNATSVVFQDVIEKSRLPNFVGVLRYDAAFGSAQVSAAVKDVNVGSVTFNSNIGTFLPAAPANPALALASRGLRGGPITDYGFAVQGGLKINLPFIAPGDTLYLQGAYGNGANNYVGNASFTGQYTASGIPTNGGPFSQYLADAVLNPLTGKLQLTDSFSVVGSFLHYWAPEWRSAVFASYSETTFGKGARAAISLTQNLVGAASAGTASIASSPLLFSISPVLRDNYQIYAGANLIWSPVKDLDIGLEGVLIQTGMQQGRVIDSTKTVGLTAANFNTYAANGLIKTINNYDAAQVRFRVQRDF